MIDTPGGVSTDVIRGMTAAARGKTARINAFIPHCAWPNTTKRRTAASFRERGEM